MPAVSYLDILYPCLHAIWLPYAMWSSSSYMVIFKLYFQLYAIWPAVTLYDHLYDVWSSSMQNVLLMNEMARRAAGLPFFQDIAARPIVR